MSHLIIKAYRTIYQLVGIKVIAFGLALIYITTLNLVTIYGLSLLLDSCLPTTIVLKLFSWPYFFITALAILLVNFFSTPPLQYIDVEKGKKRGNTPIIIYSVISLILFLYSHYYDKLF